MFENNYTVDFIDIGAKYGSIKIKNIVFNPIDIENNILKIIFDDKNIMHMFEENNLDSFNRKNIYSRFIPQEKMLPSTKEYIKKGIEKNKNFYSFLAEGILALVFRDIYGYELSKGVIDVTETLTYTHTGVDSCMYNLENSIIVLGEAKFYENLKGGIKSIINDFTKKGIISKLSSLQKIAKSNKISNSIVIKNLENNNYDGLSLEQFLNQKIFFVGFVMHSNIESDLKYDDSFYSTYKLSTKGIKDNIDVKLGKKINKGNYEIIMVHLPINEKKDLIEKVIDTALNKYREVK